MLLHQILLILEVLVTHVDVAQKQLHLHFEFGVLSFEGVQILLSLDVHLPDLPDVVVHLQVLFFEEEVVVELPAGEFGPGFGSSQARREQKQ